MPSSSPPVRSRIASVALLSLSFAFTGFVSTNAQAGNAGTEAEATQTEEAAAPVDLMALRPTVRPAYGMSFEDPTGAEAPRQLVVAPPNGNGLIIGGALVAGLVGLPFTAFGGLTLQAASLCNSVDGGSGAIDPACKITRNTGIGLIVPGILGLGGGAAMLAFGIINKQKYNKWKAENNIVFTPTFGKTARRTQTYGFALQF